MYVWKKLFIIKCLRIQKEIGLHQFGISLAAGLKIDHIYVLWTKQFETGAISLRRAKWDTT